MKKEKIEIAYKRYQSIEEIDEQKRLLIERAKEAVKNAYAPYSGFQVGAAIFLENGEIIKGSNQENVASPSTSCAERSALFYVGSNYPNQIIKCIAITSFSKNSGSDDLLSPCGNCRQSLLEYENKQDKPIEVLLCQANNEIYEFSSINQLLPFSFHANIEKK